MTHLGSSDPLSSRLWDYTPVEYLESEKRSWCGQKDNEPVVYQPLGIPEQTLPPLALAANEPPLVLQRLW